MREVKRRPERWGGGSGGKPRSQSQIPGCLGGSLGFLSVRPGQWYPGGGGESLGQSDNGSPSPSPFQHKQKKQEEPISSVRKVKTSLLHPRLRPEGGKSWPSSAAPWAQQGLHRPARKLGPREHLGFSGRPCAPSPRCRWARWGAGCQLPGTGRQVLPGRPAVSPRLCMLSRAPLTRPGPHTVVPVHALVLRMKKLRFRVVN